MQSFFPQGIFVAHVFAVFAMTAVIWFVQLVTYPQFLDVGAGAFPDYHAAYSKRISLIVVPLMLLELGTAIPAVWLFWSHPWKVWMIVGCLLTISTWLITFSVQVPQHSALADRYSESGVQALVAGNWFRTGIWTIHSLILIGILLTQFPDPRSS